MGFSFELGAYAGEQFPSSNMLKGLNVRKTHQGAKGWNNVQHAASRLRLKTYELLMTGNCALNKLGIALTEPVPISAIAWASRAPGPQKQSTRQMAG
jgi:hypothetical protein